MKKFIKFCVLCAFMFAICFANINFDGAKPSNHTLNVDSVGSISATTTLPSSYDLRDYIDIGVENQNPYGICYAFASLTSLETYLALNYGEYYDFSEVHFALSLYKQAGYYSTVDDTLNDGGNFTHFITYTQKDYSIVLEDEMPLSKYLALNESKRYSTMETDFNNINNNFYSLVKVNDTKSFKQIAGNKAQYTTNELTDFRNSVKNHIMQYGSLTAGIHTDSTFNYRTKYYKVTDDALVGDTNKVNGNIDHLISIVGWDDNYDAGGAWENKGAYLCLNSWGANFGDDGYFYVSYDDYFIESTLQGVCNATLATTHHKISTIKNHQDNTFIFTHTLDNTLYLANIFDTTNYVGESITYIDTFVKGGTTKFYIKFFDTKGTALIGLNSVSVMNLAGSSKVDEFSLYNKYQLSTPLKITNNFMVVATEIKSAYKTHSLGGYTEKNLNLEPTYYTTSGLGNFETDLTWDPKMSDGNGNAIETDATLPLILHTDKTYIEVDHFESSAQSIINKKYVKNNASFTNKLISLKLNNASISADDLNNIKITKLYTNSFDDVSSNFDIAFDNDTVTIAMTGTLNSSFDAGNYLITIPCGDTTVYRVIELQDVVTYPITYYLDGGKATNPNVYTNLQSSLTLANPTKSGYVFVGWYTDSELTNAFNPNNLPYTSLALYAKYDFALPTITSKSQDVSITYYEGLEVNISINATHPLINQYNTLSYQWYMRKNLTDSYSIVDGATEPTITLYNVSDSGYYVCQVSLNITDPSLVDEPCIKTLNASANHEIAVNIKPYIYDMSKAKWNYDEAISYDSQIHTVEVINLPVGVTATYTNNQFSEIGTYIAHAEFSFDDMNGNAIANPVEDLYWEIRQAKITITINDIISKTALTDEQLNNMYSCTIDHEYLPENVVTEQDKLNYLEITYQLLNSAQPNIKTISATTKQFDIYDIEIVSGEYRVVIFKLDCNGISTISNNGFVADCEFSASNYAINDEITNLLKDKQLSALNAYNISYSYLSNDDSATIYISLPREQLFNHLSVYVYDNNKLVKVNNLDVDANGISFTANDSNSIYIIAQDDLSHNSNTQMLIIIGIIGIFAILSLYAIFSAIKHKN